jgi:DNA-binding MarR family transcriptional regulator
MDNELPENTNDHPPDSNADQFIDLIKTLFRLRNKFLVPEFLSRINKYICESLKKNKLSVKEGYAMIQIFMLIAKSEVPPTMGQISDHLNITLSIATYIIDGLVETQLVERVSDPSDRRVIRIRLTEKGSTYYQTFKDHIKKQVKELLSHFTLEEQTQLLALNKKLLDLLIAKMNSKKENLDQTLTN